MILDGKKLRDEILLECKEKILKNNIKATLAIILVGNNDASKIYIRNKENACLTTGIGVKTFLLDESTTEDELINLINKLNKDEDITGIILQSPVPKTINFDKCSGLINPLKDIDGFTKDNIYNLYLNKKTLIPCTVKGIIRLLKANNIPLCGKHIVIVGRGNIVGHPLSLALLNENATVTVAHSKTENLKNITLSSDIVISATGIPHLIKEDMISEGTVVVDVGITRENGKIIGDVDFDTVSKKASYITPVPGGVGPMTVAMIIDNIIEIYERKNNNG